MASKYVYWASKNAIELPVAALAAGAAGFIAYIMPDWRLEQFALVSGLASVLSAAQPPLGNTARLAVMVAAAGGAFVAAFLLLRLADRIGRKPRRAAILPEAAEEAPIRRRRFDLHPDAPPRPPVCAARDLGEPETAAPETDAAPEPAKPFWLPDDFPPVEAEEADRWEAEREPEAPLELHHPAPEPMPAPAHAAAPMSAPAPEQPESIAELMARLERGLERKPAPAAAPAEPPAPQVFPEADERLQSAIDRLQRMASRGL
ncbi:MAG: hypothetical protein ACK4K7_07310 [Allosphingosinicella sp.]|uniref:hypothetical protein n=1 Tax=Allosphingosinicella sp. TaxID=2823234 RepID=UPI003925E7FA